ncbi:hypothetical protein [Salibacterium salarium]|nr:hypothetical protein [Salibacterium salarium]
MPEMMHWGDIIFSLLGFILLFAVIATTVVLLAKFVLKTKGEKKQKS